MVMDFVSIFVFAFIWMDKSNRIGAQKVIVVAQKSWLVNRWAVGYTTSEPKTKNLRVDLAFFRGLAFEK